MFQNIHAPLTMQVHIVFCIIATILYLVQYKRKSYPYYLYLLVAVDLTFITQFIYSDAAIVILGVGEIIILGFALYSRIQVSKELKAEHEENSLAYKEATQIEGESNKDIVGNAFTDDE